MPGKANNPGFWKCGSNSFCGLDAVHGWHGDVGEHDIGLQSLRTFNSGHPILNPYGIITFGLQDGDDGASYQHLIICHQHSIGEVRMRHPSPSPGHVFAIFMFLVQSDTTEDTNSVPPERMRKRWVHLNRGQVPFSFARCPATYFVDSMPVISRISCNNKSGLIGLGSTLNVYPSAQARSIMLPLAACPEKRTISVSGNSFRILLAASMPSSVGIITSQITTAGRARSAHSTAAAPFVTEIARNPSALRISTSVWATSGSSSATRMSGASFIVFSRQQFPFSVQPSPARIRR